MKVSAAEVNLIGRATLANKAITCLCLQKKNWRKKTSKDQEELIAFIS